MKPSNRPLNPDTFAIDDRQTTPATTMDEVGYEPVVWVRGLTKSYSDVVAADQVGFQVRTGEILGLLGPNGAGKTTTLECVEGLRRPDTGQIRVGGLDPSREYRAARRVMGVQLQVSALPDTMTPDEAMSIVCAYHHVPPRYDLLQRFDLESKRRSRYRELSTGQKRRLALALALAHQPSALFLDEPTAGLDVASRTELHAEIGQLRESGTAVVLATHDMAEAEKLCDRICILLQGRIVAEGTPREITSTGAGITRVIVRTEANTFTAQPVDLPAARLTSRTDEYAEYLTTDAATTLTAVLAQLTARDDRLIDLRVERPSLEERFLEITHGDET